MKKPWMYMGVVVVILVALSMMTVGEEKGTEAVKEMELSSEMDKVSYAIGVQIGNSMKMDKLDINIKVFARAIEDVLKEQPLAMNEDQIKETLMAFQQKMIAQRQEAQKKEAEQNIKEAQEFLDANKKKEGVKATESGLQYEVLTEGSGEAAKDAQKVLVNYKGMFISGEVFDSSERRGEPAEFDLENIVDGMSEAIRMMKVGDKWKIWIPPDLGYGEAGYAPVIPPNSLLIFELELLEIIKE